MLWKPSLSAAYYVFKFIEANRDAVELVRIPDRVLRELIIMRAYCAFLGVDLDRKPISAVFTQDAAGATTEKQTGIKQPGAYAMAIGLPGVAAVRQLWERKKAENKTYRRIVQGEPLGTRDPDAVPYTILPYALFDSDSDWRMVVSRRYRWPLHITIGETKPILLWLRFLANGFDLRKSWILDLTDNSSSTGALEHGRASGYWLNRELEHRAVLEITTGGRLATTWTSTVFEPADIDTRIDDDNRTGLPLFRRLVLGRRVVVIGDDAGSKPFWEEKVEAPWADLCWTRSGPKKFSIAEERGQMHLWSLAHSGRVGALYWYEVRPRETLTDYDYELSVFVAECVGGWLEAVTNGIGVLRGTRRTSTPPSPLELYLASLPHVTFRTLPHHTQTTLISWECLIGSASSLWPKSVDLNTDLSRISRRALRNFFRYGVVGHVCVPE